MKKLMIFFVFFIGLLPVISATETFAVKIEKNLTIYNIDGVSETNCWGPNVVISKKEFSLPDDSYFEESDIPKSEWKVYAKNQNGIYYSGLEKLQLKYDSLFNNSYAKRVETEKEQLRKEYNQLFAKNTDATNLINLLEASLGVLVLVIIFLIFKMARTKFRKKM